LTLIDVLKFSVVMEAFQVIPILTVLLDICYILPFLFPIMDGMLYF